jgi:hypothetical protein
MSVATPPAREFAAGQAVSLREARPKLPAGSWGHVGEVRHGRVWVGFPTPGGVAEVLELAPKEAEALLEPAWVKDGPESLASLARTAVEIQHAVNGSGLAHGLAEVHAELRRIYPGKPTEFFNQHPVVRLWVHQLAALAGVVRGIQEYHETYAQVTAMAEGRAG